MAVWRGRRGVGGAFDLLLVYLRVSFSPCFRPILLILFLLFLLAGRQGASASYRGVATVGKGGVSLEEGERKIGGGRGMDRTDVWAFNEAMSKISLEPQGFLVRRLRVREWVMLQAEGDGDL
eukprot:754401-Hanusia_phi.AAC.2